MKKKLRMVYFLIFMEKKIKNFKLLIDGINYKSVEYYFQAQKFLGPNPSTFNIEYAKIIANANTSNIAKILANQKKGGGYKWRTDLNPIIEEFVNKGVVIRPDWEAIKDDVMYKGVYEKFYQNKYLRDILLATDNSELVEDSPTDKYWGKHNGVGLNKLGLTLMLEML
jgi:ribA/ribD-fused uncharacterized protein